MRAKSVTPGQLGQLCKSVEEPVALLKVLASPERLQLLCRLAVSECHVSRLQEELGILQPTLSQQLAVLRREGLVGTRREGKLIHYRVVDERALQIIALLHQLFHLPESS